MADRLVIGVDAGGTNTRALLANDQGTVLQRIQSGGSNLFSVAADAAERNLKDVLTPLLRAGDVRVVCIGAAGVGRPEDYQDFLTIVRRHVPDEVIVDLRSDAQILLRAATEKRPALVVIAGTGSFVYAEDGGHNMRAGGYGAVIGDPGSGYAIGMAAVRETAQAIDAGSAQDSVLARSVMQTLEVTNVDEIIHRVHRWPPDVALIASLSKLVAKAMEQHDPLAHAIVAEAVGGLGRLVRSVARQVRSAAPLPVVLSGGAFDAIPALAQAVREHAQSSGPCELIKLEAEPAQGAVFVALDILRAHHPKE